MQISLVGARVVSDNAQKGTVEIHLEGSSFFDAQQREECRELLDGIGFDSDMVSILLEKMAALAELQAFMSHVVR